MKRNNFILTPKYVFIFGVTKHHTHNTAHGAPAVQLILCITCVIYFAQMDTPLLFILLHVIVYLYYGSALIKLNMGKKKNYI